MAFAANRLSLWSYNERNELTGSARREGDDPDDPGDPVDAEQFTYTYDPIGNRTEHEAGTPAVTTDYTRNGLNQYTRTDTDTATPAVQRLTYDEDGNLTIAYVGGDMDP